MLPNAERSEMVSQIQNAFSFLQKLYNESSFLIKEIEGQLSETRPSFQILRPSGYSINTKSSTGLEPINVNLWLLRKFAVAFVEENRTRVEKGQSFTEIEPGKKILYFRIVLDSSDDPEPKLFFALLNEIELKKDKDKKFENVMGYFQYVDDKLFSTKNKIDYEDGRIKLRGTYKSIGLLSLNSSDDLKTKVIDPSLKLYNSNK
jgi:hypothetical protein